MIPKAKKNLHACQYHLKSLKKAEHFEEIEIYLEAFVNSARNITFVLQKEFQNHPQFLDWYGSQKNKCESCGQGKEVKAKEGTKIHEMNNDALCIFFKTLRNNIIKKGINNLISSTHINSLNTGKDMIKSPANCTIAMTARGMYYLVHKGTSKEDMLPAQTSGRISTTIFLKDGPQTHLGNKIENPNLHVISKLYLDYLQDLVEEWTGIINNS